MEKDILQRDKSGEVISSGDENYDVIKNLITEAQKIVAELNLGYHTNAEVLELFSKLTGENVDSTFELLPPFYTDFGKNIRVGKNVFINSACVFMDRGGITIGDNVLIAPQVKLVTTAHPLETEKRRATISKQITIANNVWIGIGATIMPNVSIGENSVVGAGAVVTKNVPPNTVVAGIPAKIIKNL